MEPKLLSTGSTPTAGPTLSNSLAEFSGVPAWPGGEGDSWQLSGPWLASPHLPGAAAVRLRVLGNQVHTASQMPNSVGISAAPFLRESCTEGLTQTVVNRYRPGKPRP